MRWVTFLLWWFAGMPGVSFGADAPSFAPKSMAYVLQADSLNKTRAGAVKQLTECGRDLIVIDYIYGTGGEGLWTPEEIKMIRAGKGRRKVVAYLSIGEAEEYRGYWQKDWGAKGKRGSGAPAFLLPENPEWKGNYRVKYWDAAWQSIILKCVDDIVGQGFDGIYMDIVDGFEVFEEDHGNFIDDRKNPETSHTYRQDMIQWVGKIAQHAREKQVHFIIIPQNGSQLLRDKSFTEMIDAIGIEDLFTNGNKLQPAAHTREIVKDLKVLQDAKKPVLLIEYGRQQKARKTATKQALANGFVLLLTDRALKTMGEAVP